MQRSASSNSGASDPSNKSPATTPQSSTPSTPAIEATKTFEAAPAKEPATPIVGSSDGGSRPPSVTVDQAKERLSSWGSGIGSFFSTRASRFSVPKPAAQPAPPVPEVRVEEPEIVQSPVRSTMADDYPAKAVEHGSASPSIEVVDHSPQLPSHPTVTAMTPTQTTGFDPSPSSATIRPHSPPATSAPIAIDEEKEKSPEHHTETLPTVSIVEEHFAKDDTSSMQSLDLMGNPRRRSDISSDVNSEDAYAEAYDAVDDDAPKSGLFSNSHLGHESDEHHEHEHEAHTAATVSTGSPKSMSSSTLR